MKKLSVLTLAFCMLFSMCSFVNTTSAKATNYLTAEQKLDEYEHAVYEAVIEMLESACGHSEYDYDYENLVDIGEYLFGEPSEYRILELALNVRDNASDIAVIRFVRIGEYGGKEDFYYYLYTETFEDEQLAKRDLTTHIMAATSGKSVMFDEIYCGVLGDYQSIILGEQGIAAMADTEGASYITRINRALDEYWDK